MRSSLLLLSCGLVAAPTLPHVALERTRSEALFMTTVMISRLNNRAPGGLSARRPAAAGMNRFFTPLRGRPAASPLQDEHREARPAPAGGEGAVHST